MEDTFDPAKEGRRIVRPFGEANERQVTEDMQRQEEAQERKDKQDGKKERDK
jgi:hypothetical protein